VPHHDWSPKFPPSIPTISCAKCPPGYWGPSIMTVSIQHTVSFHTINNPLPIYFLTARPWAEHGSCSTLGLFFFYFFFVGDQTQISTRPTLNYAICNVYSPNLVSSGSTKISDYKITPNLHIAKKSLQNPDIEVIYHFSVNSYHTSAEGKSIP